jgi:hypothetical protein
VKLGKGQIARSNDHIRCGLNQFRRKGLDLSGIARAPAIIKPNIAGVIPAQITKRLAEGCEANLSRFVSLRVRREKNTNAPHARAPLRARGERPAAAPPRRPMNSRRLMAAPGAKAVDLLF